MRFILLALLLLPIPAFAQLLPKPDDIINLSLSSEAWVTTKTARVVIQVNAAVSGENAGTTREAMLKAVQQLADADWRLTTFNRAPTQAGLESWYAQFEARLPEKALGGLNEKALHASKPGMQLSVAEIDFTPTLAENEAVRAELRKDLMQKVSEELKAVNAAFPGRDFRVAEVDFGGVQTMIQQRRMAMAKMQNAEVAAAAPMAEGGEVQTAQKLTLTATVSFAALAPLQPPPPAAGK